MTVTSIRPCGHDWSFDGHQKTSSFICNDCGAKFDSEGVPDSFNVPDNIIDQLTIEVMRHGQTCTALTCYEAIKAIQAQTNELASVKSLLLQQSVVHTVNLARIELLDAVITKKDELISECIEDNLHLADGDVCTLKLAKDALAIQPCDYNLVQVGYVDSTTRPDAYIEFIDSVPDDGTKLYMVKKKGS